MYLGIDSTNRKEVMSKSEEEIAKKWAFGFKISDRCR